MSQSPQKHFYAKLDNLPKFKKWFRAIQDALEEVIYWKINADFGKRYFSHITIYI